MAAWAIYTFSGLHDMLINGVEVVPGLLKAPGGVIQPLAVRLACTSKVQAGASHGEIVFDDDQTQLLIDNLTPAAARFLVRWSPDAAPGGFYTDTSFYTKQHMEAAGGAEINQHFGPGRKTWTFWDGRHGVPPPGREPCP